MILQIDYFLFASALLFMLVIIIFNTSSNEYNFFCFLSIN